MIYIILCVDHIWLYYFNIINYCTHVYLSMGDCVIYALCTSFEPKTNISLWYNKVYLMLSFLKCVYISDLC